MKQFILRNRNAIIIVGICVSLATITMSFRDLQFGPLQHYDSLTASPDSIPGDNRGNGKLSMKEYDRLMHELSTDITKFTEDLKKLNDETISKEINEALDKINFDEIKVSIDKAMKEIDFAVIEKDVQKAMKEIDWEKMDKEITASLKNAKDAIDKIDMKELKEELEKAKKEIEKSREEIRKIDFNKISKEANEEIKKAGENLRRQKEMFNEMQSDGLIKQSKGFEIEYKKGNLYINGKKQPEAIANKYRKYFNDEDYKIEIDKE